GSRRPGDSPTAGYKPRAPPPGFIAFRAAVRRVTRGKPVALWVDMRSEAPTFLGQDEVTQKRKPRSNSVITSAPKLRGPALALPPFVPFEGGGASFDPLAIPLPPELAPPVYGWLRR